MKVSVFFITFLMSLSFAFGVVSLEDLKEPHLFKASIKAQDYHQMIKRIRGLEIDIAGVDLNNSIIDVLLNSYEVELLNKENIEFETNWSKSVSFDLLVDQEYQDAFEVERFVQNASNFFPELTKLVEIGKSFEGRSIWALKISDNPQEDEASEPAVLFNSMHHAREIMTPEVSLDIIEYLLSNYESDPKVKNWVDQNEIWVVPMLNVDGNAKVWGGENMWRKNTRDGHGVDLNRNYPFGWNSCRGSSGNTWADDYRGPEAASEPETRALMGLVEKIKPVFDISYHSYSELVLYPYGCKNSTGESLAVMKDIGEEMGRLLGYRAGTPWEILYEADGSDIDWMLGEHQVIPYVIELNSRAEGFQPPYATTRDRTVELNRKGWQLLLDRLEGSGVAGVLPDHSGEEVITVFKGGELVQKYRVNPNGSYHIVLTPGEYTLEFKNRSNLSQSVTVKEKVIRL